MAAAAQKPSTDAGDFVISRIINAPRDLVWKAWTDVAHLKRWWGPKGFTVAHATLDLAPGGAFHYGLKAPNGSEMWGKFIFREIAAPARLVFVSSFSDAQGGIARAPFFDGKWPLYTLTTVTLADRDGQTELTVRAAPIDATADEQALFASMHQSMQGGWGGTFEQLSTYLAKA